MSTLMRSDIVDNVEPGGAPAPLGARGTTLEAGVNDGEGRRALASFSVLVATLVLSLIAYAAIATDVVHDGRLTEVDQDVSNWVAGSMPAWAEWLARPFTVIGGVVCVALIVVVLLVLLWRRGEREAAGLLAAVSLGVQVLVWTGKNSYDRPRPTAGSPIEVPDSFSFPSGHAATSFAVFGLLGILAATRLRSRVDRIVAVCCGFGLAILISASRVVLNVHFLTDVLAGAALGLAWLCTCLLTAGVLARRARSMIDSE